MTWTEPPVFSGEFASSADLDTLGDNLNFLAGGHPLCKVRNAAGFSHVGSGWQTITFDTEVEDSHSMWASGGDVDIPMDGWYHCEAGLEFPEGTYNKVARIMDDDDRQIASSDSHGMQTPTPGRFSLSGTVYLTTGQSVRLEGFSDASNDGGVTPETVVCPGIDESAPALCVRWVRF